MIPEIHIEDYHYPLDESRIAKYPLPERDGSKLLYYNKGIIQDHGFRDLPDLLPEGALMIFNDTRVVPARLHFMRESGARIEIFCLEPADPAEYNVNFATVGSCAWKCVIGNAKRWKGEGEALRLINPEADPVIAAMDLRAELVSRDEKTGTVRFTWADGSPFSQVLERCGTIPIPPYLNRESEAIDSERYQTLYARIRGSVAAPTAGLHFTEAVLERIRTERKIDIRKVCLHVGAGTFLPVKTSAISGHKMHREPFSVSLSLLKEIRARRGELIAVGTTSVRTLESLYYAGAHLLQEGFLCDVEQWDPYEKDYSCSTEEALDALIAHLEANGLDALTLGTRIIIVPGFRFRLVDRMVTNFHQSESTLILLISAFVGGNWRPIYEHAIEAGYRFLSYGDSSLLVRQDDPLA